MRTKSENQVEKFIQESTPELEAAGHTLNQLAVIDNEISENAISIARQLGYDGSLTVGALEDEIRFYQRRSIEACLELGKRLLVLKELAPYGEFEMRVELLGFSSRLARQFMSATLKFSDRKSTSVLKAANSQTKMLELLVLDDGEIEALESGETIRGVTLDKIEMMSVSELKKALRESQELAKAKDDVIKAKSDELNKKQEKLALLENTKRQEVAELDMPGEKRLMALQDYARTITAKIEASLRSEIVQLMNEFDGQLPKHMQLAVAQSLGLIITAAYGVAGDLAIAPQLDVDTAAEDPAKADAEEFLAWQQAQLAGE